MYHPTYLLELMCPRTGELEDADVFARLDTAVEKAFLAVNGRAIPGIRCEVSQAPDGAIDGVGFFDGSQQLVACVTVYRLEFDTEEPGIESIKLAHAQGPDAFENELNRLLGA